MPALARSLLAVMTAGAFGLALGYVSEAAAGDGSVRGGASLGRSGGGAVPSLRPNRREAVSGSAETSRPTMRLNARRLAGRGYRDLERSRHLLREEGSIIHVRRRPGHGGDPLLEALDAAYGILGGDEAIYVEGGDGYAAPGSFPSEARLIDIDTARLDRLAPGPGGIDTIHTGSAKIIRIGAGQGGRHGRTGDAADGRGYRQPWSSGWR